MYSQLATIKTNFSKVSMKTVVLQVGFLKYKPYRIQSYIRIVQGAGELSP